MPRLSYWFIRAALVYLAAGITLGAFLLANKGLNFAPLLWRFLPVHFELLLVGWLIQFAFGVAYWIFPRFLQGPPRGNENLVWPAFVLLNLGVGWVIAEAMIPAHGLALVGHAVEAGAVLVFVLGVWRRVKA